MTVHRHMDLIRETATDGEQRALDADLGSLEDLQALRLAARELIVGSPIASDVRHVMPWLWSGPDRTKGTALTAAGAEYGYELRFSRYQRPAY